MDIQYIFGICAVVLATVGIIYYKIREHEINKKYEYEARTSAEYERVRREADEWRKAYEEEHAHAIELNALLKVQNLVYGKAKVKDYGKNLHGRE